MKKTSSALVWRFCVALTVALGGCAQVLGIDGWTDKGAGGQGGEQSSSSTTGTQGVVTSSAATGGQGSVGSSTVGTGGQTTVSSSATGPCKPEGVGCQDASECCTNQCNNGVCTGCLSLGTACAGGGCCPDLVCGAPWKCCRHQGSCTTDSDCCSNICFSGNCGVTCNDEAEPCAADVECCPGLVCANIGCHLSCQSQGDSCASSTDCCAGLICDGGMCSASCTALWNPCASTAECCPGLGCPAGLCHAVNQNQYESGPNEDFLSAKVVQPGIICSAISPAGDHDWYSIILPGGVKLNATVGPGGGATCGPGGAIDSIVEIRIPPTQLALNDNISLTNYCSNATAPTGVPGIYFVHVAAAPNAANTTFGYCLTLLVSN